MLEIVVYKPLLVPSVAKVSDRVPELMDCGDVLNAEAFKLALAGEVR
jgi:hypothetical protein